MSAVLVGGFALPATAATAEPEAPVATSEADAQVVAGDAYPGAPEEEARLIADEERRLFDVRSVANAADWTDATGDAPFRMATGSRYTLVLPSRAEPYTFDDLRAFLPRTLVGQPDGSWLLSENVVVDRGATLQIAPPDATTLRLASDASGFTSIVTIGGSIDFRGAAEDRRLTITSWDATTGAADLDTTDGRSYVRATGGKATLGHVDFADLGFWSGLTGGVSMTGTDTVQEPQVGEGQQLTVEGATLGDAETNPTIYGSELLPVGGDDADPAESGTDLRTYSYVSALVDDATFTGNAFGLFVAGADGIEIRGSTVEDSLVDGIVMHRDVTNSSVVDTTVRGNAVDGISLQRATTGIVIDRVRVEENGRNGVTVDGGPLAEGPSATGSAPGVYGNNSVASSTVTGNGRYGIEVISGVGIGVTNNTVRDQQMGIVVRDETSDVEVSGNVVEGSVSQGIAIRDGVTDAVVTRNDVTGGEHGIYVRDADARVERNDVDDTTVHAVTVVGAAAGSAVVSNTLGGRGTTAVDTSRVLEGAVRVSANDVIGWQSVKPLDVMLRSFFQPLTVMWILLAIVVVVTALIGLGSRRRHEIRDPYANLARLDSFSKGTIEFDEASKLAGRPRHQATVAAVPPPPPPAPTAHAVPAGVADAGPTR